MAITKEDILEAVGALTVMELNDWLKSSKKNSAYLPPLLLLLVAVLPVVLLPLKRKPNST